MKIVFVDIQNFRKLKSIRIAFSDTTTLFVGANNSGKTSAMLALGHFLINHRRFSTNDFTLSNWASIDSIGSNIEAEPKDGQKAQPTLSDWEAALPALDIWIQVEKSEVHYVRKLLPTLDWKGGLLGVRLRYEPKKLEDLYKEYLVARTSAKNTMKDWKPKVAANPGKGPNLWPENMRAFLDRKLRSTFITRAYLLDPNKCDNKKDGVFAPQELPLGSEAIEGNPLDGLIRIDEIAAQRNLGGGGDENDDLDEDKTGDGRKLSNQLRSYYSRHLDPSESPEAADLDALEAIETSQKVFDDRLADGFKSALEELQSLNYPGITDPKLKIATRIRPNEGMNHSGAVQFEVLPIDGKQTLVPLRLPEEYNGLGYQNLISMVFKLMSFRDAWMRVGKASKAQIENPTTNLIPPLHLVLVEEPEAHLHAQVQQVFLRKAYEVLRNHVELKDKPTLRTQLIVSTHSSHVAHEAQFSWLRYFRRLPPSANCCVPTSVVVNLSEVFGPNDETQKFVTRYLRATHCDLFFADAAILLEGAAERILLPHFIRKHFTDLNRCYVSLLEIGGSHAHQLQPLFEHLGLTALIITDLDSVESTGHHKSTPPIAGAGLWTANATLKEWHPKKKLLDELLSLTGDQKIRKHDEPKFFVRVAFQLPVEITFKTKKETLIATTFEDALVLENLDLFAASNGQGMVAAFKEVLTHAADIDALRTEMSNVVRSGEKARFALDLLIAGNGKPDEDQLEALKIPGYINEGLLWVEEQLVEKKQEILESVATPAKAEATKK